MCEWVTTTAFTERVNALMRDFHIPGFSVAVLNGDNVYTRSSGHATIENSKLVDASTIFDVASCSKALTGVAMGILIESHPELSRLGWKTPVVDLLGDDFVIHRGEDANVITIEDLLSHMSGFSGHDMSVHGVNAARPDDVRSVTRNLRSLPSTARPGEKYQYSNIMYAVATHVIEVLSGQTFSVFLRTNIFEPLGMQNTFLQPSEVHTAGLDTHFATPYFYADDNYHQADHQETPAFQGAGSIQTTPSDYLKSIAAMLKHDKLPITKSIYNEITKPRVIRNSKCSLDSFGSDSSEVAYALSWDIKHRSGRLIVVHDGVIPGYSSRMFFLPGHSFGAVIMGNCDTAFGVSQMLQTEMIEEFLNILQEERFDGSQGRLKRQIAQETRKKKQLKRNEERRLQARDTLTVAKSNYCGTFYNAEYREINIQLQKEDLHINAADRSEPFNMILEHIKDNRIENFEVISPQMMDVEKMKCLLKFRLDAEDKVTAVGFNWEPMLGSRYLFWHERVPS